ncbi:hypothetical protein H2200_009907 [Cladophialophora chaetospira]|uniref:BTB domain-containing protein n=1 Tax=Cladophialophora chaetospira TaxID=386627 RepID=A0AA38X1V1_9EURO|nr:hypothetical protein H2200_009907 [Cladophialophora chaetospira]
MASQGTPRSKASGKYANPTIPILIGENEDAFNVHYSFLEKTAFFEQHGYPVLSRNPAPSTTPSSTLQPVMSSPAPSDGTVAPDEADIKMEGTGDGIMMDELPEPSPAPTTETTIKPYKLKGLIFDPAAFEVIVNYLYNQYPQTPLHRNDFKTHRKAYILALRYRMEGLQDQLVECFRAFHVNYTVHFDDLTWIANRIPGIEAVVCKVPLVQYLVDQCAYEIYREGYDEFARQNHGFELWITDGTRLLRKELFVAMSRISKANNPHDPAVAVNQWRVRDWPQYDPSTPMPAAANVIDVDD